MIRSFAVDGTCTEVKCVVRRIWSVAAAVTVAIVLSACSKAPQATTKGESVARHEPAKPPEAIAARIAYFEMRKAARAWAPDLLSLTLKSGEIPAVQNEGGKAGLWTAVFVSPSRREARTFNFAVADKGMELRKGLNVSDKQSWAGATPASKTFIDSEFIVDSDAAYKVGAEKAAGWLKTHPNAPYTMTLGNASRFPAPVWYIMWGTNKSGYIAYVNATTGEVVK